MKLKDWMNKIEGEQLNELAAPPGVVVVKPQSGSTNVAPVMIKGKTPAVTDIIKQLADTGELSSLPTPAQPGTATTTTTGQQKPAGTTGQPPAGTTTVAEEEIEEVITKKSKVGDIISDFVHSDDPRFDDDSKKERIKRALGAYYGMHPEKSRKDESVEELREGMEYSTMNEALKQILDSHPHEHKMCQEGWGMDESLYEALCDHYYREGRIPRKIWHGALDELRRHVEECYAKDTGMLLGENESMLEEEPLEENPLAAAGSVLGTVARAAAPAVGMAIGNKVAGAIDNMEEDSLSEDEVEEGLGGKLATAATLGALTFGGASMLPKPEKDNPYIQTIEMEYKRETDPFKRREISRDKERTIDLIKAGKGVPSDIAAKYPPIKIRDSNSEMTKEDRLERMLRHSTEMDETMNESKFSKLKGKLKKKGAKDPAALAAWIGREKLGQKEMTRRSVAGRKRADEDFEQLDELSSDLARRAMASANSRAYDIEQNQDQRIASVAQSYRDKAEKFQKYAHAKDEREEYKKNLEKSGISPAMQRKLRASGLLKDMAEGVKKTEKGLVHKADPGGYGRKYDTDEEGDEKADEKTTKKEEPKRGRGRPKKSGGEADTKEKYTGAKGLQDYIVGNLPKGKLPGKPGKKHKLSDKETTKGKKKTVKEDAQIALWHQQLGTLLKEGAIKEGLTVSTSVGQEGGHDSVSITASDDDAHNLLSILQSAGLAAGVPANVVKAASASPQLVGKVSAPFSVNTDTEAPTEPEDCETADHDSVMGALSSGHDGDRDDGQGALDAIKRLMGAHGAVEVAMPEGEDHDDEPVNEDDLEEGGNAYIKARLDAIKDGKDTFKVGGKTHKVTGDTSDERKEKVEEEDIGQSAEEDRAAEEEGEAEAEAEKMEEGVEHCEDCGSKLEEGHQCESKMEESQELREWANSPMGRSAEEQFTADIDFMTKIISGGLNGSKSTGQTTVPVIASQLGRQITKEDADNTVVFDMKKLAGIVR